MKGNFDPRSFVSAMTNWSSVKFLFILPVLYANTSAAQHERLWHGIEREIHYKTDGEDFVLVNGKRRFNRALYGGNTAFRAEAGDLPEFALYLPGMGGNLKFGLIKGTQSKWLIDADKIETRYRAGSMIYTIKDALLGDGVFTITALATFDREAFLVKIDGILNNFERGRLVTKFFNNDRFIFKLLVLLKKVAKFIEEMFRQLLDVIIMIHPRIVRGHRNDFIVRVTAIDHLHYTHNFRIHQTQGLYCLCGDYENIQWILVAPIGLRYKTVVTGIVKGGIYDPVQAK